jgi:hypothetical protein
VTVDVIDAGDGLPLTVPQLLQDRPDPGETFLADPEALSTPVVFGVHNAVLTRPATSSLAITGVGLPLAVPHLLRERADQHACEALLIDAPPALSASVVVGGYAAALAWPASSSSAAITGDRSVSPGVSSRRSPR